MYLDVPFVHQLAFGGGRNPGDPTGCWAACACMLVRHFDPEGRASDFGSGWTTPSAPASDGTRWDFTKNSDFSLPDGTRLVELGFALPAAGAELETALRRWGPLIVPWEKVQELRTGSHASLIIGVDGDVLIHHDPENAPRSRMALAEMRSKQPAGWPVLRREPAGTILRFGVSR